MSTHFPPCQTKSGRYGVVGGVFFVVFGVLCLCTHSPSSQYQSGTLEGGAGVLCLRTHRPSTQVQWCGVVLGVFCVINFFLCPLAGDSVRLIQAVGLTPLFTYSAIKISGSSGKREKNVSADKFSLLLFLTVCRWCW